MAMGELAARLHCKPPNATFLCGQLEQRGLVQRLPDSSDRRLRVVSLTQRGKGVREAMLDTVIAHGPLSTLDQDELDVVGRLLAKALRPS